MTGLDIWFREDIQRILTALASAGSGHGPEYLQALYDVALAFGLDDNRELVARRLEPRGWSPSGNGPGGERW